MDFEWTAGVGRKGKWRPPPLSLLPPPVSLRHRLPLYHHRHRARPPISLKCFLSNRSPKQGRNEKKKKKEKTYPAQSSRHRLRLPIRPPQAFHPLGTPEDGKNGGKMGKI